MREIVVEGLWPKLVKAIFLGATLLLWESWQLVFIPGQQKMMSEKFWNMNIYHFININKHQVSWFKGDFYSWQRQCLIKGGCRFSFTLSSLHTLQRAAITHLDRLFLPSLVSSGIIIHWRYFLFPRLWNICHCSSSELLTSTKSDEANSRAGHTHQPYPGDCGAHPTLLIFLNCNKVVFVPKHRPWNQDSTLNFQTYGKKV